MNLARSVDTKSIYKKPIVFYISATNNWVPFITAAKYVRINLTKNIADLLQNIVERN